MRLSGTKTGSANQYNGLGDQLYDLGGARPTLDLNFANNGSLVDSVTGKTLVQHTRASSATYVDGDGVIRNAVTNYVRNSEDLNATGWGLSGSGPGLAPVVTADAGIAPDGTQTAWQVDFDKGAGTTSNDQSNLFSDLVATTVDKRVFHSVYLKTTDGSTKRLRFDFNGAFANVSPYNKSNITVTGEWQRFIIGYDSSIIARNFALRLRGSQTPNDQPTASVYLWHPQTELFPINTGSPGEYVPNLSSAALNSAPRFDHDPTTGESLGLLVEEARTNLSLYSEDFGDAVWSSSAASISTNTTAAPDGTTTADTVNSSGTAVVSQLFTKAASAITYTGSLFVKGSATDFSLTIDDGVPINRGRARFNLSTGTLGSVTNEGTFTGTTSTITLFPNGWYRLTVTTTTNTLTTARLRSFWTGAGTSLDFWGAQLEVGAFPTSYIPTTTATVTRAADISTSVATSVFESSWYRQDEGTVFAESSTFAPTSSFDAIGNIGNSITPLIISLQRNGTNSRGFGAGVSIDQGSNTYPANTTVRQVIAAKVNDFALSTNASSIAADTSTDPLPTAEFLNFGVNVPSTATYLNGHIRRLTYWPTRLGNEVLQRITQ